VAELLGLSVRAEAARSWNQRSGLPAAGSADERDRRLTSPACEGREHVDP
jgi:hypothetical protein